MAGALLLQPMFLLVASAGATVATRVSVPPSSRRRVVLLRAREVTGTVVLPPKKSWQEDSPMRSAMRGTEQNARRVWRRAFMGGSLFHKDVSD
jgi:hypothetical protein